MVNQFKLILCFGGVGTKKSWEVLFLNYQNLKEAMGLEQERWIS